MALQKLPAGSAPPAAASGTVMAMPTAIRRSRWSEERKGQERLYDRTRKRVGPKRGREERQAVLRAVNARLSATTPAEVEGAQNALVEAEAVLAAVNAASPARRGRSCSS
jgi:hypothetical protein